MKTTSLNQINTGRIDSLSELLYKNSLEGRSTVSRSEITNYINESIELKKTADYFGWSTQEVNRVFLIEAWTHRSFSHENKEGFSSYERWEFLGDAVFGQYITRQLFERFSKEPEGVLSKIKNQLVSGDVMAQVALGFGLDKLIILGRGESLRFSEKNTALLADIFESTIGVLSYSLTPEELTSFLDKLILDTEKYLKHPFYDIGHLVKKEFKGELQELTMKEYGVLPEYISDEKNNEFHVKVYVNNKLLAENTHNSKKTAQKICAKQALEILAQSKIKGEALC